MTASSLMLHLPWSRVFFFDGAIAMPSAALCGLAVGLGALFPNLREDNPSKIVSGFGGTLCLIVSFVYIVVYVAFVSRARLAPGQPCALHRFRSGARSLLSFAASVGVLGLPMFLALRRVKNLEF